MVKDVLYHKINLLINISKIMQQQKVYHTIVKPRLNLDTCVLLKSFAGGQVILSENIGKFT